MDGIQVGLSDLYYAIMTTDTSEGATYLAPVNIPGAINAKISPKVDSDTLYADNIAFDTDSALGAIDIEIEAADLDLDTQAALLGHSVIGGVIIKKASDVAPYVAFGFKSVKSNGKTRFLWLLKGKFEPIAQEFATKEGKPKFQTPKIKGTFLPRIYDTQWQKMADEDHPSYVAATGTNWFTAVDSADTTPPTISTVVPASNATGIAVGATVQWTFSEQIDPSKVTDDNFVLFKDSDGSMAAGALTYDSVTRKVTFTPSANLAAATAYRAFVSREVRDLAGNKMAANSVTKFTTA